MLRVGTFTALRRNPNYRLYWIGALTSNLGTWMQFVAQGWLVYELTGSTLMLGVVGFAQSAPFLVLSLYGGVLADRFERRRLMVWTQTGMMIQGFVLAGMTLSGTVTAWWVVALAAIYGAINAINTPVRQAIVADLVRRDDLQNAIALNSLQFQSSRTVGPAIAGVILASYGAGWCFLANALSFIAVIFTLLRMELPPLEPRPRPPALAAIGESLRYVRSEPILLAALLLTAVPSLFSMPYQHLMPAVASDVLRTGPEGFGVLQSASGIGAVVSAFAIASLGRRGGGTTQLVALVVGGVGVTAFGLSTLVPASIVAVFVAGLGHMAFMSLNMTGIHSRVAEEMRGRVTALLTMMVFGLQPMSALLSGAVAEAIGVQSALALSGILCAGIAIVVAILVPKLRA